MAEIPNDTLVSHLSLLQLLILGRVLDKGNNNVGEHNEVRSRGRSKSAVRGVVYG
jgi:hypothetical protein